MKAKRVLSVLVVLVMMLGMMTVQTFASDIRVLLDGKELSFDVPPQLINDRTMVPMRAIFEGMGADVEWNGQNSTVLGYKSGITVLMQINNKVISINGRTVELDVPPMIVKDRTLVPVRAVAESLNARVLWDENTKTVKISSNRVAPYSFIYSDDETKLKVGINNAQWVAYKEDGKVCLRNRYTFVKENYISVSSYPFDGDFSKTVLESWVKIKNEYGTEGTYQKGQEVKIGRYTKGYIYPYSINENGKQLNCNVVYWMSNGRFYTCTSSAVATAPDEVYGVLVGVMDSFSAL